MAQLRIMMQWLVAPLNHAKLVFVQQSYIFFVVVSLLRHVLPIIRRKKDHWGTKISSLWPSVIAWSVSLTRWTGLGTERVAIRAMLIHLGLRLLPVNVFSHEKEMDKMGTGWPNKVKSETCAYRDLSPPRHLRSSCRTQLVDRM